MESTPSYSSPVRDKLLEDISIVLPSLAEDRMDNLIDILVELGVESCGDMSLVQESDLVTALKPIEARKLLKELGSVPDSPEVVPGTSSSPSSTCSSMSSLSDSLGGPLHVFIQNQDPNWPQKFQIGWNKVPEITFNLRSKRRLEPDSRRKLVRVVVDDVRKVTEHALKRQLEIIAKRMIALYPDSLEDIIDGCVVGSGYDSLLQQLISRNENLNRGKSGKSVKRKLANDSSEEVMQTSPCSQTPVSKRSRDSYGCIKWSPEVDSSGDSTHLETKKTDLKEMHSSSPQEWNIEIIQALMNETYCLQRRAINDGDSIDTIMTDWPFLSESFGILGHFKTLVGIDAENALREGCKTKGIRLQRYFCSEMRGELDPLFQAAKDETANNSDPKAWIPSHFLCLMKCLNEKETSLFLLADETATVEEVEKSNTESYPRLVLLGDSYLSAKEYMVVVDHKVIVTGMKSFLKAVGVLFATYYVFNIKYQLGAVATLEFLQRFFMKINPDKGCKADRKKKTYSVNARVLKLLNNIVLCEFS